MSILQTIKTPNYKLGVDRITPRWGLDNERAFLPPGAHPGVSSSFLTNVAGNRTSLSIVLT
jgi:hypothetical protein